MRRKLSTLVAVVMLISLLVGASPGLAKQQQPPVPVPILLKAYRFTPAVGDLPAIPAHLSRAEALAARDTFLVQFRGPVEQAWKDQVAALGVEFLEYVPDFAFKVRMNGAQALQVRRLDSVNWVGLFHPAYKLSPSLKRDGDRLYVVELERGSDLGAALNAILAQRLEAFEAADGKLVVAANGAQIEALALLPEVAWIEDYVMREKHNEYGAGQIIGAAEANTNGYDGSTQTVAVADTGLGGGTAQTAHPDIPASRIVAIYNWPGTAGGCFATISDDGSIDVDSGHGTHVSGSVLGDGGPSGEGKGSAPAANLVFQSTENYATLTRWCALVNGVSNGYFLVGLPSNLRTLFQQAYDAGARIHANSWGSAVAGDYTTDSVAADDFVWTHPDMVITFSAGNEGIDQNSDGAVDADSIGSPGTSKNVITIGASENDRAGNWQCDSALTYVDPTRGTSCASLGGQNDIASYGASWPADYPADPLKSDPAAGNSEQMAAFSSRGPTDDGRIKPDVVAPGTWILSGYSDLYQEGYDGAPNPKNNAYQYDGWGFPLNSTYKYMGGTSMSNPIAAGGAAVVRDYYQKAHGLPASAALVKATLINSAVDLLDENNDGVNDNDFPIPNLHEGWGRIDLRNATDGSAQFTDNAPALGTNGSASTVYNITDGSTPFKVTLAWSDYASTASAAKNLVNDLDLVVTSPSGAVYQGNTFSGGWSNTGGNPDRTNNVENVFVNAPETGNWTVQVKGYNVPNGPQAYALVADGVFGTSTPSDTGFVSPSAQAAANTGDRNGFEINPTFAFADDGQFAEDRSSGTNTNANCANSGKDRTDYSGFTFNFPSGVGVKGIEVRLDARVNQTGNAPKMCVQLSWNGGSSWTAAKTTPTLTTGEVSYLLGGANDTWGRTWSLNDFAGANFRARVIDVARNTSRIFYLDWAAVKVYFQ